MGLGAWGVQACPLGCTPWQLHSFGWPETRPWAVVRPETLWESLSTAPGVYFCNTLLEEPQCSKKALCSRSFRPQRCLRCIPPLGLGAPLYPPATGFGGPRSRYGTLQVLRGLRGRCPVKRRRKKRVDCSARSLQGSFASLIEIETSPSTAAQSQTREHSTPALRQLHRRLRHRVPSRFARRSRWVTRPHALRLP